jgi:hypothetical protein
MTGGGVSDGDMAIFPWPARGDVPPAGDPAYDALLTGKLLPEDAAEGLRPVAEAIAALNAAASASELAAAASALAEFRRAAGLSAEPARSPRRRHPLLKSLLSAKLAAAAAAVAVSGGGVAAAAYAGALPASMQKIAHNTLGAPAPHPSTRPSNPDSPAGPDAAGRAAYGLCTAYAHLKADGTARQKAVAFRNLATAAGGAANVAAYCARVAHPGPTVSSKPTSRPTGKPTSHPNPTTHPTGKPTRHPKPTGRPTAKPTGAR